jgi:flagellar hook-associated protein 2
LYAQFSRLDANIGTINGLGSFVSQQIAQWNKG